MARSRTRWLGVVAVVALAAVVTLFVSRGGMRGGEARRNVVLITIDTLRADYVGCFGAPGDLPRGKASDAPVSTIDILPTILDFLAIGIPEGLPAKGESLMEIVRGRESPAARERPIFFETAHRAGAGVKLDRMKYIHFNDPDAYFHFTDKKVPEQLFYLKIDPGEKYNLSDTEHPALEKLRHMLAEWEKATGRAVPDARPEDEPDEEFREKIRQLGYVK